MFNAQGHRKSLIAMTTSITAFPNLLFKE